MTPASLALLLAAAVCHATTNLILKQARDKIAFLWWTLGLTSILGAPLWFWAASVPPVAWRIIVVSGLIEAVYFGALSRAYSLGDLSQVYPIARGSAPLFIALWAGLFLGERPSPLGVAGILVVVAGLCLINAPSLADWYRPLLSLRSAAASWALLTGLLISAYTTVDKLGMRYVDAALYLYLILFVCWLALTIQWLVPARRQALLAEARLPPHSSGWTDRGRIVLSTVLGAAGYLLVLNAMRQAAVGYVGAVREVSVVFGAWLGTRFLHEPHGPVRMLASGLVVAGTLLIAMGG